MKSRLTKLIKARINVPESNNSGLADQEADALFYMGNWHDAIPRAVLIDPTLQSVDKCVYMLLRTYLSAYGSTKMPSYEDIGRHLGMSRGTVSRCLSILRATRWITLCNEARSEDGRFKGNIYALHDEVISIEEAVLLDGQYIESIEAMETSHPHNRVQSVAHAVLEHIRSLYETPAPDGFCEEICATGTVSRFMVEKYRVQILDAGNLDSDDEPQVQKLDSDENYKEKQEDNLQVQKLDSVLNSYCSSSSFNKSTTTNNEEANKLFWPSKFSSDHRKLSWFALRKCDEDARQLILDECASRYSTSCKNPIRDPIAWINWAVNEVLGGNMPISNRALEHAKLRQREIQSQRENAPTHKPESINHVSGTGVAQGANLSDIKTKSIMPQKVVGHFISDMKKALIPTGVSSEDRG